VRRAGARAGRRALTRSLLRATLAAAATAAAFALYVRVEWPWFALGWVGLVPWLAAVDAARTPAAALVVGLLESLLFTAAVFWWFAVAIAGYTGGSLLGGALALAALAPVMQPQFPVAALAWYAVRRRGGGSARATLAAAGAYVGAEWACPKLFADTIGHGFLASRLLRQAADVAGAPGLTFVLVVANGAVLAAIRRPRAALAPLAAVAAMVAVLGAYGAVRLRTLAVSGRDAVTAAVVQGGVAHYEALAARRGRFAAVRKILASHFALSRPAIARGDVDLVVWPETVYPTTFGAPKSAAGAAFDREIARFVAGSHVPLVFGTYDAGDGREYNAAVALAPAGAGRLELGTYRKAALFPLTERVPAVLESAALRRWLPWLGTWAPGTGGQTLDVPRPDGRRLRIAPLICYDAVEPRFARAAVRDGAELLVTLSNDSWFAVGGGPRLHLVVAAFRSLETRRPQVRATNTGVSAVISATGELLETADVGKRRVLVATVVPERRAWTLALAWGDWFGPVAAGVALALAAPLARRRRAR
jgi:apolipoprotein N-acyltransferase